MPKVSVTPTSDRSLRLELAPSPRRSPETTRSRLRDIARAIAGDRPVWMIDVVPSAESVLIVFDALRCAPTDAIEAVEQLARDRAAPDDAAPASHTIDACYDPELASDLEPLAAELGLTTDRLIKLHSSAEYTVECIGFQPGFAYLVGLPEELHAARLSEPRPAVPAGAVGIGGARTGVYPHATPGGWRLIACTAANLFDPASDPPATLAVGDTVRFRPITRDEVRTAEGAP